jgi:RimJ/RimL family protein N-acetyltransferase
VHERGGGDRSENLLLPRAGEGWGEGTMTKKRQDVPAPWLETLRLDMRDFTPPDSDDLFRLNSDPRVMRYIGDGKPVDRDRHATIMRRVLRYPLLYPDLGFWYTTRRDTGAFIGWFTLKYCGRSPDVETGYMLLPDAWGHGFATEGASALIRYGFDDLGIHRIIGVTHPDNVASQNVLQKAGLIDSGWGRYYDSRLRLFAARRDSAAGAR